MSNNEDNHEGISSITVFDENGEIVEAYDVTDNEELTDIIEKAKEVVAKAKKKSDDEDFDDDDDDYFDYREAVGDSDPFISRLFANIMATYKPVSAYDNLVREMVDRMGSNLFHRDWIKAYEKKYEEFRTSHPENKFVLTRECFAPEEIVAYARMAIEKLGDIEFPIAKSVQTLADILDLTRIDTMFLQLSVKMCTNMAYTFHNMFDTFKYSEFAEEPVRLFAQMFDITEEEVRTSMKGFLFQSGLLTTNASRHKPFYYIHEDMREAFCAPDLTEETLTKSLFPTNITTDLVIDDYDHLKKEIGRTEAIINNGLAAKSRGINVMFWGLPGTGKTELALALAKRNGWNLRIIGDISDSDTNEKSRAERLISLKIAQKLYGRDPNTVLLFDEMEDLFKREDTNAAFSKAFINRIIETTQLPIIWTTNDLEVCGSAVLRRMIYNIAFEVPPLKARRAIWERYKDKYELALDADALDELAEVYNTTPALISNAAKITSLASLEGSELPEIVKSLDRLVHYGFKRRFLKRPKQPETYDVTCANTDADLSKLTDQLEAAKPGFSLLLWGAPGTGKSEYGRYVANRLGRRFIMKRASDLMSPYLGETEMKIAAAFEEAVEEEAVLLIDEGDSFLRNREGAVRSWEVSQVNEMLSQMEAHKYPFIMTTNLMDQLDPAAMRRFTFKMKFDFMTKDQSFRLFKRFFKVEAPSELSKLTILAPGDFAVVAKRAAIIDMTDANELYEELVKEVEVKPQFSKKMGF